MKSLVSPADIGAAMAIDPGLDATGQDVARFAQQK
jgi:hypothetical protein